MEIWKVTDQLILGVFKELATMNGLRSVDGKWASKDEAVFRETLRRAIRMVVNDYDAAQDDLKNK